MKQKEIEKFRVIGACTRMQTTTWEDEMKLMDGVPYEIDFARNFTGVTYNGIPIESVPIRELVEFSAPPKREQVTEYSRLGSSDIFKEADKYVKKERKRKEKWKRKKKRDKRSKKEKIRDALYLMKHFGE